MSLHEFARCFHLRFEVRFEGGLTPFDDSVAQTVSPFSTCRRLSSAYGKTSPCEAPIWFSFGANMANAVFYTVVILGRNYCRERLKLSAPTAPVYKWVFPAMALVGRIVSHKKRWVAVTVTVLRGVCVEVPTGRTSVA